MPREGNSGQADALLKTADAHLLITHQLQTGELLKNETESSLKNLFNIRVAPRTRICHDRHVLE